MPRHVLSASRSAPGPLHALFVCLPAALEALLLRDFASRISLIDRVVVNIPVEIFSALQPNRILAQPSSEIWVVAAIPSETLSGRPIEVVACKSEVSHRSRAGLGASPPHLDVNSSFEPFEPGDDRTFEVENPGAVSRPR